MFSVLELREVISFDEAKKVITAMHSCQQLVGKEKNVYIENKAKKGSTLLRSINYYNIDDAIKLYESQVKNSESTNKKLNKKLQRIIEIKELLIRNEQNKIQ
jgi:hypothetical protein